MFSSEGAFLKNMKREKTVIQGKKLENFTAENFMYENGSLLLKLENQIMGTCFATRYLN